jgi:hypothetical protein
MSSAGRAGKEVVLLSCGFNKVKIKFSLCLTKHHAMKTYWGVEV